METGQGGKLRRCSNCRLLYYFKRPVRIGLEQDTWICPKCKNSELDIITEQIQDSTTENNLRVVEEYSQVDKEFNLRLLADTAIKYEKLLSNPIDLSLTTKSLHFHIDNNNEAKKKISDEEHNKETRDLLTNKHDSMLIESISANPNIFKECRPLQDESDNLVPDPDLMSLFIFGTADAIDLSTNPKKDK